MVSSTDPRDAQNRIGLSLVRVSLLFLKKFLEQKVGTEVENAAWDPSTADLSTWFEFWLL